MPHSKSRLAMELWCHAVDTLLAKGASFADALDGANVILQAHQRQNEVADERERDTSEADAQLLGVMQRSRLG